MADLYRKSALERISSPEQLDKALVITSPMSWLALAGVTLIIVVTLVWSIIGTIPVTVTTSGVISSANSTNAVYIEDSGTVQSVLVRSGTMLHIGDPVLNYKLGNGTVKTLYSNQVGTVSAELVKAGDSVVQGSEVVRISPSVTSDQVVVCYVGLQDAKKLERGMDVYVYLSSADSQTYGHTQARIVNIDSYAASGTGMTYVLGTDNNLASHFLQNGAVVAVTCELYPDDTTVSGYYWSNEKGAKLTVSNGSLITAKVIIEEIPPISKLFSKAKEIWGE